MGVRPHVVIVGAGFGGLAVARGLAKAPVDVTIIDRQNYTTFQPLLYQVATSGLNAADVAYPVRGMFHRQRNVTFRRGTVTGVDWRRRELQVRNSDAGAGSVPFHHLVIAAGAVATWFGVDGAVEHSFPLYTLDDSVALRNHVVGRFEAADANPALIDRGALTFVIVGGGPTGVETAGALAELFAVVFRRDYPHLDITRARVILVEAQDVLLGNFAKPSQRHAAASLGTRGVELRLGESVDRIAADHVRLATGETIPTETVIWAAGVRAHPLAEALGLANGRQGRIEVGPDLAVAGHDNVWAIGDIAAIPGKRGATLPQLAPVAMQSGDHVAKQVSRLLEGKGTQRFSFFDRGTMATIGRRSAVAELPGGIKLGGTPAWLAWLALHLLYLAGARNRASVLLNWFWSYLTWDRGPRLILGSDVPGGAAGVDGATGAAAPESPPGTTGGGTGAAPPDTTRGDAAA